MWSDFPESGRQKTSRDNPAVAPSPSGGPGDSSSQGKFGEQGGEPLTE